MNPQKPRVLTADQARKKIKSAGKTVKQWATENGFDQNRVYRVLNGFEKCQYGKSFDIAVKLGMKTAPAAPQAAEEIA